MKAINTTPSHTHMYAVITRADWYASSPQPPKLGKLYIPQRPCGALNFEENG